MLVFSCGTVIVKLVQFLLMPLLTTYMNTSIYGTAEMINNLADLLLPFVTLNMYEAVFRYSINSECKRKDILNVSLSIYMISFFIGLIMSIVLNKISSHSFLLFLTIYTYAAFRFIGCYIRGKGLAIQYALGGVIDAVVLVVLMFFLIVVFDMGVNGYIISICGGYIVGSFFLFFSGKVYKDYRLEKINVKCFKIMLKYSFPLIAYGAGFWMITTSGRYILLWFTNASTAGIYIAAMKISAILNVLSQSFEYALKLSSVEAYESKDKEKFYSQIYLLFALIFIVIASLAISMSPMIASFMLKKEFFDGTIYIPLIIFSGIINCISCVYGNLYSVYMKTRRLILCAFIGMICNLLICVCLIPHLGIWGVIVASVFSYLSQLIYKLVDLKSFCRMNFHIKSLFVGMFILMLQTVIATVSGNIASLLSWIITLSIILFLLLWRKEDLKQLIDLLIKRFR